MILVVDNYDSFSYNLVQLLGSICMKETGLEALGEIRVIRNDECNIEEIITMAPSHIVISPGPGRPKEAGICEELILQMKDRVKILGICLGHQAICEAFGGRVTYAKQLMHGKSSEIEIDVDCPVFYGLPGHIRVARYHSLAAEQSMLPDELQIVAMSEEQEVMAVKHKIYDVFGLQFHPESVLTPYGYEIMKNFLCA